jgi:hypothetical protein
MAMGAARKNHSLDCSAAFNVKDLKAARDEWRSIDGNVCHLGWILLRLSDADDELGFAVH